MKIKTLAKLLVLPMLILPGCKAKEEAGGLVGSVTIRDVKYDGDNNRITWRIVTSGLAVVSNYTVTVNGEQKTINYNGSAGSYSYNADGKDFEFSIVCNDNLERHAEYSTTFINLGRVQDLAYDGNGMITWNDPVGLADFYTVKLNNKESTVNECAVAIQPGAFNVQVRPTGTPDSNGNLSTYSKWSEVFRGTLLAAPGGLSFDSERITWNTVSGASSYVLTVNGNEIPTTTTSYPFSGHQEDLSIAVKAVGDGQTVYDSQYTTTQDYKYIAPVDPTIENGVVKWNPPAGATRYMYKLNGIVQQQFLTEPKYDKLIAGVQTRIQVLPMGPGDNTYSQWSTELSVIILEAPALRYNNNVIIWDPITGAGGYGVRVVDPDGLVYEETLGQSTLTYDYPFAKSGTYSVSVKANGDTTQGYYDSQYSTALSIYRLPKSASYELRSDPEASVQLSITCAAVTYANGYVLYANNKEVGNSTDPRFEVDVNSLDDRKDRLDIAFRIMTKGSVNGNPLVLDSLEGCEFNATRLATPTNVNSSNSVLYWDPVTDANGYIVTVDDNSNRYKVTNTQFDLKLLTPGQHNIYVQAYGNGTNLIASRTSDPVTITRLEKPVLHIEHNSDSTRYYVGWQEIQGATNYVVKVGNNTHNVENQNFFNLSNNETNFAEGHGNQLSAMAVGNGSTTIDSEYSDTLTIIRHARPTNLALYGNNLQWQSTNVDTAVPTKFQIDITGTETKNEKISGSSYDLSSLSAGTYSVRVKTLGEYYDGTINSEYSDTFSFRKLEKVSNIVKSGTVIRWSAVSYATRYNVRISGITNPIQVTNPQIDIKDYILNAGTKNIQITALGDAANVLNSDVYEFAQEVKALTAPVYVDNASANTPSFEVTQVGGDVTVRIYPKTTNHTGYNFIIGGTEHKFTKAENPDGTYQFSIIEKDHYISVRVALLGFAFGEDGVYYLDSNQSENHQVIWHS